MNKNPPYDDNPCPACPVEIRNLYAVAYNITKGSGMKHGWFENLKEAVEQVQPIIDAHFADRKHSYGSF